MIIYDVIFIYLSILNKINNFIYIYIMVKTKKNRIKKSVTKKNKKMVVCPIGLKSFEDEFSKKISPNQLRLSSSKSKQKFVKQLLGKFAPHSIKPENDFYDFINYQWLKNVSLEEQQKYIVQIDDFRLAQDKVYHELDTIILDYTKTHNDKLSKNLKNFYNSVILMNPKPYSKKLAFECVKIIEKLIEKKNPWEMLAYFNKDEVIAYNSPFVWSLNPDDKDTKIYRCYIGAHQFELADLNVYYDDGSEVAYKKKYREEYKKFIKKVFNILIGKNNYNPQDVLDVEIEIFNALGLWMLKKKKNHIIKYMLTKLSQNMDLIGKNFQNNLGLKILPNFLLHLV